MSAFQIVNGYVCFNCSQVALAQKGVNPADPPSVPGGPPSPSSGVSNGLQAPSNTQSTPSVTFGGGLGQLAGAASVQPTALAGPSAPAGQQSPGDSYNQLNILV